ncbi:MAG TPA: hypothetical protein VK633_12255, partial [Verrucomicrobiae bacterium]|nr:hypothetical protein [Verrucomicrobiae bacterium]
GCREAGEELNLELMPKDLHLLGLISERGYEGQAHWLMFLFEVKVRLKALPPVHAEGRFSFFARTEIDHLATPRTDAEYIWPSVWKHRGGFFAAHCLSQETGAGEWLLEESRPAPTF